MGYPASRDVRRRELLGTPVGRTVQYLSHLASQHLGRKRLLQECPAGIEPALIPDRVVRVTRDVQHFDLRVQVSETAGEFGRASCRERVFSSV